MRSGQALSKNGCSGGSRGVTGAPCVEGVPAGFLFVCVSLVLLWDPAVRPAVGESTGTNRVISTSSSGRFLVVGPDGSANMQVSRWAESVAGQLERFTGIPFSLQRGQLVEIRTGQPMEIARLEIQREGDNYRRVLTLGPESGRDPERLDEWLCRALVLGYMEEQRRAAGALRMANLPEWLTMGMAQNLRTHQRVRNRNVVSAWRVQGGFPGLVEMMQWESLPAGWPRHRALCGVLASWIAGHTANNGSPFSAILGRLARGETVTPEWMAVEVAANGSIGAMQSDWISWLGRQANLVQSFGELSSVLVDQLQAEIPLMIEAAAGRPAAAFSPREALAVRSDPAVAAAALEKSRKLRVLTLGKAVELMTVGERFARFYEDLVNGAPSLLLRYRIRQAEAELERLGDLTRRREAYLDAVERETGGAGSHWEKDAGNEPPVLDKGPMERYVDAVENKHAQQQAQGGK